MPDDRIKISALPSALTLDNTDVLPIVQGIGGDSPSTKKAVLTLLASHILETMSFNNLNTSDKTIVGAINSLLSNFADAYDVTSTYDVGDCVIYNGVLYQCNTAITVAEEWDATHWTAVKAVDVGSGGGGGGLSSDVIAPDYDSSSTYSVGDYVMYEDELYICNTAITVAEAWTASHWTSIDVDTALATKADIVTNKYLTKTPVQTYTGYRMSYRTVGVGANMCYVASDANSNCKAYKVTAGVTYRIQAYGYDVDSFYIGAIGEDLVSGGQSTPTLQPILCGGSTYPTDYTNHIVEFTAQYTGYLYINERPSTGVSAYAKGSEQIDVRNENGLIIKDGKYTHFVYLGEGQFLIREFTRRGPNNLFQLVHVGIGYFANNIYVEKKSFMTATTDIIGPFSIDKVGWGGGEWTGGNHSVTVNGVACPTAEQLSLSVTVNNEAVSDNGTYYGDIKIIAKNKLYFAQTITGNTFTGATPAILETRLYNLTDTMNVEVYIELLDDIRFSKYHGMQYVNSNVVNVVVPDDETVIALADLSSNYSMAHKQPNIILQYTDGEELHMILHRSGLGSYAHNNGNEYYGLVATYGKTYHTLISSETISTGAKLYWSGEYRMIV